MKKILVVGSGIAGLIAALRLSERYYVTLVTKSHLEDSNTRWAQGGIAAAMASDDSIAEHIADTLRAGAGICDAAAVEVLCAEGPARIRDLIRLGVRFDMNEGQLARGLEAAHTRARVLHAGGDSTGLSIETALVRALNARAINTRFVDGEQPARSIKVLEHTFARDLVMNDAGDVIGLEIITEKNRRQTLYADAVVLASGGAGQLFRHTTNPAVATGDGIAMALRAGAELADLEFYQFHPTALATEDGTDPFLISEAVRGEGAVLRNVKGERFMQAIHPNAELAPRDVVARSIAQQMASQNGAPVLLDATALGKEFLQRRFPTIDAACHMRGLDWSATPIQVTPAAHYWMGGVRTDLYGRTTVPGLYAVGEAACTGVHGANRLASNSLLESLVFAWRCAELLLSTPETSAARQRNSTKMSAPSHVASKATFVQRTELQKLLWNNAGIERSGKSLKAAATQLASWNANIGEHATVEELETANLLDLGRALVSSALAREESRGAHYCLDYPESNSSMTHSLTYVPAGEEAVAC